MAFFIFYDIISYKEIRKRDYMSKFYIENSANNVLDNERNFLLEQLNNFKVLYNYELISENDIKNLNIQKDDIPVGSIQFVENFLKITENPIEIPKYLRTEEFLKRDYKICTWDKIPRYGVYFLKDVSKLKLFGNIMNANYTDIDDLFNYIPKNKYDSTLVLDKNHLFQVSNIIDIKSEYRVYVFGGEIEQISYYNGDCTIFPDVKLINKAINLINYHEKWLKSYTIDVAVNNNGTCLLEIHNFTSCGLYSTLWGSSLIYAYKDGIDYLIHDNHKLEI